MTLVGKILVVVLVFFSVGFMFFAVAVYSTQTNWKQESAKLSLAKGDLQKEIATLQGQKTDLSQQMTKEKGEHAAAAKQFEDRIEDLTKRIDAETSRSKAAQKEAAANKATADAAMEETKQRREEVKQLTDQLKKSRGDFEVKAAEARQLDEKRRELVRNLDVAKEREKDLNRRLSRVVAAFDRVGGNLDEALRGREPAPPPPNVEGVVRNVSGGYVEISLGSDQDIRKGNFLEVFRTKPESKYLGRIRVVEADPHQSVGKILVEYLQGQIKEGDLVATRIH